MSVSNLESPTNLTNKLFNLYCNSLSSNDLTFQDTAIDTLKVNNILELTTGNGINIEGVNVSNEGLVTFSQNDGPGILLPSIGGVQTLLNYYEIFEETSSLIGPWTPNTIPTTMRYARIGNIVTMSMITPVSNPCTSNSNISLGVGIPPRFTPSENTFYTIVLVFAPGNVGSLQITSGGNLQIIPVSGAFAGGNVPLTVQPFSVTYTIGIS
jgi:hypothetical protein